MGLRSAPREPTSAPLAHNPPSLPGTGTLAPTPAYIQQSQYRQGDRQSPGKVGQGTGGDGLELGDMKQGVDMEGGSLNRTAQLLIMVSIS